MQPTVSTPDPARVGERTLRKVWGRIVPFFFVLYIIAYLDRANVAFAKMAMSADLGFSEAVYGFGAGVFFIGYFLLEIPGTLIVERWSARLWMSRIMITWGLLTATVGFVHTPFQFYVTRFCLGLAEAGFFPGVIVYLSHWFPARQRARAMSGFIGGVPVSMVLGAPISAAILGVDWFGLAGWRWVFILEGLPAIVGGIAALFVLTDWPRQAKWLDPEEREWLEAELEHERSLKRAGGHSPEWWRGLRQPHVLILSLTVLMGVMGQFGFILWLPQTIQQQSGHSGRLSTALAAIPFVLGIFTVWWNGRSSDRSGERRLHASVPLCLAGISLACTLIPGQPFPLVMLWLSLTGAMIFAWGPPFWVMPTILLGESAAAASVGVINSVGNLGGFVGPSIIGWLLTGGRPLSVAVVFSSVAFLLGGLLILCVRIPRHSR